MITEYVLFDLSSGISHDEVVRGMREVAPRWRAEPDLIRKTFVNGPVANQSGVCYLWKSRAAAAKTEKRRSR